MTGMWGQQGKGRDDMESGRQNENLQDDQIMNLGVKGVAKDCC